MTIRQMLVVVVFLATLFLHATTQVAAWRAHMGEPIPATAIQVDPGTWDTVSFPVFVLVPRRLHHIYFWELMLLNSTVWAGAAATLVAILLHIGKR